MALSVLQCGGLKHGIWDSEKEKFVLTGTLPEMEYVKDQMERVEQAELNRQHFDELKKKYIAQLVSAGNSEEQATAFLKERMPFLW